MGYMTDERRLIQETARAFAMKEVLPVANKLDPEKGELGDLSKNYLFDQAEARKLVQAAGHTSLVPLSIAIQLSQGNIPEYDGLVVDSMKQANLFDINVIQSPTGAAQNLYRIDRITDALGDAPTEAQVDALDRFRQVCDEVADLLPVDVVGDAIIRAERDEALRRAEGAESTLDAVLAMLTADAAWRNGSRG